MRVTSKGQVTIPRHVRESLGISTATDVDFVEENGRYYIVKINQPALTKKFRQLRGIANTNMSTDDIMRLTREEA